MLHMYIYAEFVKLKDHLDILSEEKRTVRSLIEEMARESSLADDDTAILLRKLAEQGTKLESSIDNRIQLIEEIISDFKKIEILNSKEIEEQTAYLNSLMNG